MSFRSALSETFLSFPRLPAEIRLKIWGLALPGPRLVPFTEHRTAPGILQLTVESEMSELKGQITALLQTNHESRSETLRSYYIIWCPNTPNPVPDSPTPPMNPRPVYVNPKIDTMIVTLESTTWFENIALANQDVFEEVENLYILPGIVNEMATEFIRFVRELQNIVTAGGGIDETTQHSGRDYSLWFFNNLRCLRIAARFPDEFVVLPNEIQRWAGLLREIIEVWYEGAGFLNSTLVLPKYFMVVDEMFPSLAPLPPW